MSVDLFSADIFFIRKNKKQIISYLYVILPLRLKICYLKELYLFSVF